MKKPKFIVIEGIDDSEKDSLIKDLRLILPAAHFIESPWDNKANTTNKLLKEMIRQYKKIVKSKKHIISSWWCPSVLVYFAKTPREAKSIANFPYQPDIYIFINTQPKKAYKSAKGTKSIRQFIKLKSKYLKYFRFIKSNKDNPNVYVVKSKWDAIITIIHELER